VESSIPMTYLWKVSTEVMSQQQQLYHGLVWSVENSSEAMSQQQHLYHA